MGRHFALARKGVRRRSAAPAVAGTAAALVGALTVASGVGATGLRGGGQAPRQRIEFCKATGDRANPYTKVSVDDDEIFRKGHGGKAGPVYSSDKDHWGDIVPAFDAGKGKKFGGHNWSPEGKDIFDKGCKCPPDKDKPHGPKSPPTKPEGTKPTPPTKPDKPDKPTPTKPGGGVPTTATTTPPAPPTTPVKVTAPPSSVPPAGTLPATGASSGLTITAGVALMLVGGGLLLLRRRNAA